MTATSPSIWVFRPVPESVRAHRGGAQSEDPPGPPLLGPLAPRPHVACRARSAFGSLGRASRSRAIGDPEAPDTRDRPFVRAGRDSFDPPAGSGCLSRTSVLRLALHPHVSIATVREELGADLALEGTVAVIGERVRVPPTSWTPGEARISGQKRTRCPLTDVFGVQSDVAIRVARALEVELSPREHRLLRAPHEERGSVSAVPQRPGRVVPPKAFGRLARRGLLRGGHRVRTRTSRPPGPGWPTRTWSDAQTGAYP